MNPYETVKTFYDKIYFIEVRIKNGNIITAKYRDLSLAKKEAEDILTNGIEVYMGMGQSYIEQVSREQIRVYEEIHKEHEW